jgi:epoxyqueuosine reductase
VASTRPSITTTRISDQPRYDPARLLSDLRGRAARLGFAELRITRATSPAPARKAYRQFIAAGRHGDMDWLAREPEHRESPDALWPDARSAIIVAQSYAPDSDPLPELAATSTGYISVYARNRDYHDVMKGRLKELAGWLHARSGAEVKVFVDTAPLLEKPLAQQAGLGWQGKHTNLVSRRHGSWLFLGEILTSLVLPADAPEADRCGSCRRCLEVCPTDAFPGPYQLDARRCISYLTIEHKGPIPRELRPGIGNRVYGCDDCLAVCPWNKFARAGREAKLRARDDLVRPPLAELAELDDGAFRHRFTGSPIKRTGRDRFVRNVLIAIGNSGDPSLVPAATARLRDTSALVRGAAVWALSRLAPEALARQRRDLAGGEDDPTVRAEWDAALEMLDA